MNITSCTLTGVDDQTDLVRLSSISKEFPIAEWGFLYSPSHQGTGRYPSLHTIESAFFNLNDQVRVALHICGSGVDDLLNEEKVASELVQMVADRNGRVQLNFNYKKNPIDLNKLKEFMCRFPDMQIITQHNKANSDLFEKISWDCNHVILFDESGGRGLLPDRWPTPFSSCCGYAGGLSPHNINDQLYRIASVVNGRNIWIDMEGSLRSQDDILDLDKCCKVLSAVGLAEELQRDIKDKYLLYGKH